MRCRSPRDDNHQLPRPPLPEQHQRIARTLLIRNAIDLRPAEDFALGHIKGSTPIARKSPGYPNIKNYVGAWGEWGNRDDSVLVIAEPEK